MTYILSSLLSCFDYYSEMAKRTIISRSKMGPRTKRQRTMSKVPMSAIPRQLIPETKFLDITGTSSVSFNLSSLTIAQGTGRDQRTGNKVYLKALDTSFTLNDSAIYRVSVLVAKNPQSAPAFVTPTLRHNQDDFHILYDQFVTDAQNFGSRVRIPLNRLQTYFGALATNINSEHVYVVVSTTGATPTVRTRLYYTDA